MASRRRREESAFEKPLPAWLADQNNNNHHDNRPSPHRHHSESETKSESGENEERTLRRRRRRRDQVSGDVWAAAEEELAKLSHWKSSQWIISWQQRRRRRRMEEQRVSGTSGSWGCSFSCADWKRAAGAGTKWKSNWIKNLLEKEGRGVEALVATTAWEAIKSKEEADQQKQGLGDSVGASSWTSWKRSRRWWNRFSCSFGAKIYNLKSSSGDGPTEQRDMVETAGEKKC